LKTNGSFEEPEFCYGILRRESPAKIYDAEKNTRSDVVDHVPSFFLIGSPEDSALESRK
jgi:hypothetical protein